MQNARIVNGSEGLNLKRAIKGIIFAVFSKYMMIRKFRKAFFMMQWLEISCFHHRSLCACNQICIKLFSLLKRILIIFLRRHLFGWKIVFWSLFASNKPGIPEEEFNLVYYSIHVYSLLEEVYTQKVAERVSTCFVSHSSIQIRFQIGKCFSC